MKNEPNKPVDRRIHAFLEKHHVLTLATAAGGGAVYCSNLFYAWLADEHAFVFTSSAGTLHMRQIARNPRAGGSVVLETRTVGKVQGVQFTGYVADPSDELLSQARRAYLKRFPYAALSDLELRVLVVDFLKFTDNRLGFGKKLIWGDGPVIADSPTGNENETDAGDGKK